MLKILPFIFLIILGALIFFSPLFKVKTIDLVQDQNCLSHENLNSQLLTKNIFLISPTQLEQKILTDNSCVKNVKVSKIYPSKVQVKAEADKPVVKIEGTNFYLTEEGQVLDSVNSGIFPILFFQQNQELKTGQKMTDPVIISALHLASQLSKSDFTVVSVRIVDPETIAVYNAQDTVAIFSPKKDQTVQVDSLQQVISKAKIDAAKIAKIDLRFDKPVVTNK